MMRILTKRRVNGTLVIFCFLTSVLLLLLLMSGRKNSAMIETQHDDAAIRKLILQLENNSPQERRAAMLSLHAYGKKAIPLLIEDISNSKEVYVVLSSPRNSDLRLALEAKNYAGTLAAYVIELILSREQIILEKNDPPQFLLGDNPDNYIFWEGVLKKNKGLAKKTDLPLIKKLYQRWWEKNKGESIERLREKQKSGERVLDRKPFYWQ